MGKAINVQAYQQVFFLVQLTLIPLGYCVGKAINVQAYQQVFFLVQLTLIPLGYISVWVGGQGYELHVVSLCQQWV